MISNETNTILENVTKSINKDLNAKYYQWQVFEVAIEVFERQLKYCDDDRKRELFEKYEV